MTSALSDLRSWRRALRWARVAAVAAMLAFTAYGGLAGGVDQWRSAGSLAERVTTAGAFVYGGLSIAGLLALLFKRDWVLPLVIAWGVSLAATGGLAAVVYGGTSFAVGAIAAASVAAVVGLVLWAWIAHRRRQV